jgi:hypothetical protein
MERYREEKERRRTYLWGYMWSKIGTEKPGNLAT